MFVIIALVVFIGFIMMLGNQMNERAKTRGPRKPGSSLAEARRRAEARRKRAR